MQADAMGQCHPPEHPEKQPDKRHGGPDISVGHKVRQFELIHAFIMMKMARPDILRAIDRPVRMPVIINRPMKQGRSRNLPARGRQA